MLSILTHRDYRHLFLAQVIALIGTGLSTVALSLLAFELAGEQAGLVLGTALTIKMLAYVFLAPISATLLRGLSRKRVLVTLDLIRAGVALALPFVTEVWHVYLLIFLLQSASACFTPLFQASIPDLLPDKDDYTKALSLSRLAYDLENILSPTLAALLLGFITWHSLFSGTVIGFIASALLVLTTTLPRVLNKTVSSEPLYRKTTRGMRFYLATPRLRGLLALNFAVSSAGAMVIVNTVVLVQSKFGLTAQETATAMAFFGGGSMLAALTMPRLLERFKDRTLMFSASSLLVAGLILASVVEDVNMLHTVWVILGLGYAWVQTPSGRLITRSCHTEDRPDLFAAQFSLSHACWMISYPMAGYVGVYLGLSASFILFAVAAMFAVFLAYHFWPTEVSEVLEHDHSDLPEDHPHLSGGPKRHTHPYVIDDLHLRWPG